MRISFRQLSLFVATAQRQNITQAAATLYLSQSAASMTLTQLETQLGTLLFDRLGKKLVLNAAGKILLPKAVAMLDRLKEIETLFDVSLKKNICGTLKISASTTIGNYLLPKMINQFMLEYPGVYIILEVTNTENIINQIQKFDTDIGFVEGNCQEKDISTKIFAQDNMLLFCAPKNPLAKKKSLVLKDLKDSQWLLREKGSGTREITEHYFSTLLTPENIRAEITSSEAIKSMVQKNLTISCLSTLILQESLAAKKLIALPLKHKAITRNFYQLTHKERYHSELMKLFLHYISAAATQK
jgi:DNA-binding transcriptional LysR family regulator